MKKFGLRKGKLLDIWNLDGAQYFYFVKIMLIPKKVL